MSTLTEFLLARLDEDERELQLFVQGQGIEARLPLIGAHVEIDAATRRMAAEIEGKRRIVKQVSDVKWAGYGVRDFVLENLALPYASHPDFLPDWRP